MSPNVPSTQELIDLMIAVSSKTDPFAFLAHTLSSHWNMYPHIFTLLIVLGGIYIIIFSLSLVMLLVTIFRKGFHPEDGIWFWRKQFYLQSSSEIPYYVPNGNVAVLISQCVGALLFEMYALTSYISLKGARSDQPVFEEFWLATAYTPGVFGFWHYGFSAYYLIKISRDTIKTSRGWKPKFLTEPFTMNLICIGYPILVAILSLGWGCASVICRKRIYNTERILMLKLKECSSIWRLTKSTNLKIILTLEEPLDAFTQSVRDMLIQSQTACIFWSLVAFCSITFYAQTTWIFLRLIKKTFLPKRGEVHELKIRPEPKSFKDKFLKFDGSSDVVDDVMVVGDTSNETNGKVVQNPTSRNNEVNHEFLTWHCAIITLVLTWYFFQAIALIWIIPKVFVDTFWRAISIWLISSSALFLSLGLFIQSVLVFLQAFKISFSRDHRSD